MRHTELAFEDVVERELLSAGYAAADASLYDRERALFPEIVLDFIRRTQPKEWEKLEALHGPKTGEQIIGDLCKWMDAHGSLSTLRHGFKCYGRTLRVAYFKAAHELNAELAAAYAANRLSDRRRRHPPVSAGSRPARGDLRVQAPNPGSLRRRSGPGLHDHAIGGWGHAVLAV